MQLIWFIFPTTIYLCLSYIRLNFTQIKSFVSSKDLLAYNKVTQESYSGALYMYALRTLLVCLIIVVGYSVHFESVLFLNKTNLLVITSFALVSACFWFFNLQQAAHNLFYPIATVFTLVSAIIVLTSNLYQMYLVLEVLAYTNLLFISAYRGTAKGSNHLISSLVVSFILNFIASIIIFTAFTMIIWEFSYPTWWVFSANMTSFMTQLLLTVAVLVKLGTGPWVSGNVTSYAGYSLEYLVIYTLSSVLLVTPVLLTLFTTPNLAISSAVVLSLILYISQTSSSVRSIKALFAYSTVIMLLYVILMLII